MGASEKILQAIAARNQDMELDLNPQARYGNEVPDDCRVYEIDVIFDGAVDETFDFMTQPEHLVEILSAVCDDVSREYAQQDGTLGWSVEIREYTADPTDNGQLSIPMAAEPVMYKRVAPTL